MKKSIQYLFGKLVCLYYKIDAGKNCYVAPNVKIINRWGGVKLKNNVIVRPGCNVYAYKGASLCLGNNVEIGKDSCLAAAFNVEIHDGVLTGPRVFISDHNHEYHDPYTPIYQQGISGSTSNKVIIGEGTWLGTNVVISGNIKIGKHCIIGANSVVTKDIPDYTLAVGVPCKPIKKYDFKCKEWIKI